MKLKGKRCQCSACEQGFNRESTFNKHRVGVIGVDRRCLTVEEMKDRGWRKNDLGFWLQAPREVKP